MEISDTNRDKSERTVYRRLCTGYYIRENYHVPQKSASLYNFLKNTVKGLLTIGVIAGAMVGGCALSAKAYDKESEFHESQVVPKTNANSIDEAVMSEELK